MKDEYKKVKIPFGFNPRLERVLLSLFHTFFVAMTGHGKTLGMKSLLLRFHELFPDWKILIIDSKDKRDYADLNADIPICFVETTEPLDLKNLLEPIVGAKMMYYFDKIIEEAIFDTLGEMQRNIEKKVDQADSGKIKIHGKELGKLRVLNHLLKKLVVLVEQPNITPELKLHDGFNVMSVSLPQVKNPNLKKAFQQLIVRSALLLLLSDPSLEKTLLVLDENHKWNPQRYSSICKQPLSEFISEGRSQDKIVWMADQALTKVDKESLKNVKVWVVGQQMEENEVEDAMNAVNDITDLKVSDREIKTLKVGNFVLVDGLHGTVDRAYLQPYGVPDEIAIQIVKDGTPDLAESYILEYEKSRVLEDGDLTYKPLYEEEKRKREEAEKNLEELNKEIKRLNVEVEWKGDEWEAATSKIQGLEKELEQAKKDAEAIHKIKEGFLALLPTTTISAGPPGFEPGTPSEVSVNVEKTVTEFNVSAKREAVEATDKDVTGQILLLAADPKHKGWLNERRRISDVRGELYRVFNSSPRPGTIENSLAELAGKGILEREREGKSWFYWLRPDAQKLIKVSEEA
jgi:hypothetical protein